MNRELCPSRRSNPHSMGTAYSLYSSVNEQAGTQKEKELLVTAHIIFPSTFPRTAFKIRVSLIKFLGNAENRDNYSATGHFTCLSLPSVLLRSTTGPGGGLQ